MISQLTEPLNSPQPLSKPHPPILIGGMGERKTLRLNSDVTHDDREYTSCRAAVRSGCR